MTAGARWPEVRVAVLDTAVDAGAIAGCERCLRVDPDGRLAPVRRGPAAPTHAGAVLRLLARHAPATRRLAIQVVEGPLGGPGSGLAAALAALPELDVDLVSVSLGLRSDRRALRAATARLVSLGVVVCASAPARGGPVYPAAYPGVLAVSGDARCGDHQHSVLGDGGPDFGACTADPEGRPGGASFAVPRISGRIARFLAGGGRPGAVPDMLRDSAAYRGRERRVG